MLNKKNWASFQRIIEPFTQKVVTKLQKIWGWDPGSEKNLFRIPVQGQKDTGSRIRIRNTGRKPTCPGLHRSGRPDPRDRLDRSRSCDRPGHLGGTQRHVNFHW